MGRRAARMAPPARARRRAAPARAAKEVRGGADREGGMPAITRLRLSNFRNFDDAEVRLGRFNVIIGANASGKSNLVQALRFLRDVAEHDLGAAISRQGGIEHFRNAGIGAGRKTIFEIEAEMPRDLPCVLYAGRKACRFGVTSATYKFAIATRRSSGYRVASEEMEMAAASEDRKNPDVRRNISLARKGGRIMLDPGDGTGRAYVDPRAHPGRPGRSGGAADLMLLSGREPAAASIPLRHVIGSSRVFDFDPRLSKSAIPATGRPDLAEDGSNISLVAKKILEDGEERGAFVNFVNDMLPFVGSVGVGRPSAGRLLFNPRGRSSGNGRIPASLVSDGAANVVNLLAALYFDRSRVKVIEEPERGVHPSLLPRLVQFMADASRAGQILVTTHSPEIVKARGLDGLVLLKRTHEGHSRAILPAQSEEVRGFLKSGIGVDDLFVDNMLEVE